MNWHVGYQGGGTACLTRMLAVALSMTATLTVLAVYGPTGRADAAEPFAIETFTNEIVTKEGQPVTQAGAHPYAMATAITFAHHETELFGEKFLAPTGDPKTIEVGLPRGLIVNPEATPAKCTESELEEKGHCPNASAVGIAEIDTEALGPELFVPVFNMVPPTGVPAEFGLNAAGSGLVVHIVGKVRTGTDYGLSAEVSNITQKFGLYSTKLTLWGDPGALAHNLQRGRCIYQQEPSPEEVEEGREIEISPKVYSCPVKDSGLPLLTMPTICTARPLEATLRADSWQEPPMIEAPPAEAPAIAGCEKTSFTPDVQIKPDPEAAVADSPSGLNFDLRLPQEESLVGLAQAQLKRVTVHLPKGVTVSPAAATGLAACAPDEIALNSAAAQACPSASRIGDVEVITPLLAHPLKGGVFLAQQNNNPFGSLLAIYVVVEGSGVVVKLPGHVEADSTTGQLTTRFDENPPLPFSELKVSLYTGPHAPLMTPFACGTYQSEVELEPWSNVAAVGLSDSFTVGSGCGGAFSPYFAAGTTSNQADAYAPFTLALSRADGEQRFGRVQLKLPPGLLGVLKNVPRCAETQAAQGTCGPASEIGRTTVAAGPGANSFSIGGKVFLTGPYAGAPFGLSIVVPAVAGPFDLGKVVVRASIFVDPTTAQVTVRSDALPEMINSVEGLHSGIPTDLRTINVVIDRPSFIFNPTNCDAQTLTGLIESADGGQINVGAPFQVANCATLPFRPSFAASTTGSTSKALGASLTVKVAQHSGEANIRKVEVSLPLALPSRLTTLQKACTEAQFSHDPAGCPGGSNVGTAIAHTPVLDSPLTGPAYLVSHGGAAFPDLVLILSGEGVTIMLTGHTDIKKGVTHSRFETVPDAPISAFELNLPESAHSALAANVNLCAPTKQVRAVKRVTVRRNGRTVHVRRSVLVARPEPLVMPTKITGQNGVVVEQSTKIAVTGCVAKGGKAHRARTHPGRAKAKRRHK